MNKGFIYEKKILSIMKNNNLVSPKFLDQDAAGSDNTKPDMVLCIDGHNINIEVKKSIKSQAGGTSIRFDGKDFSFNGSATMTTPAHAFWDELNAQFPEALGARQIYDVSIEMVQSSCGFAVPLFDHLEDRQVLSKWAEDKGRDGVEAYWNERNGQTLDGFPTTYDNER